MPVVRSKPQNRNGTELEIRNVLADPKAHLSSWLSGAAAGDTCRREDRLADLAWRVGAQLITEFPAALSMKLRSGQIEAIYPARRASDVLGAAETSAVSSTTRTAYPCASSSFATLLPPKSFAHTNGTNIGL